MKLENQDFIDDLLLEDRLEKILFLLCNIVDEYYLPNDAHGISPTDVMQYMTGEADDDKIKEQEAKICIEYNTIITNADMARDYCIMLLNDLKKKE